MEDDLRRIDMLGAKFYSSQACPLNVSQDSGLRDFGPIPYLAEKTWVVFRGKTPGVYDYGYVSPFEIYQSVRLRGCLSDLAAFQTQGFSDGFQKAFPDRDSAEAAWSAFARDGTYPDYGRAPWVVFLGRRPGVYSRM